MSWWQIQSIKQTQQLWERSYYALPPDACPRCGQPLDVGYQTQWLGGQQLIRHCDAGHYTYTSGRRET